MSNISPHTLGFHILQLEPYSRVHYSRLPTMDGGHHLLAVQPGPHHIPTLPVPGLVPSCQVRRWPDGQMVCCLPPHHLFHVQMPPTGLQCQRWHIHHYHLHHLYLWRLGLHHHLHHHRRGGVSLVPQRRANPGNR